MADNSDSEIGAFLSGFVIGGLVGAAVALIMAPQSGEETRAQIRQRSIELRDQAYETAEETRKRAEEAAAQARARAEQLAAEARARAETLGQEVRTRADELQHRGKEVFDEQRGKLESAIEAGKKAVQQKRVEVEGTDSPKPTVA